MAKLVDQLELPRCPHCKVDTPSLVKRGTFDTQGHSGGGRRFWKFYACSRCGGIVTAASLVQNGDVSEMYPSSTQIDESIPPKARTYLNQALNSLHSSAGAVMLAASAVDAMLKAKDYKVGSLHARIKQAAEDHLITEDMAKWAHQVRLDANEQRHSDEEAPLPSDDDARRSVEFAVALAQFLFVLPSRVTKGLAESSQSQ